jgi:hypothetical protein
MEPVRPPASSLRCTTARNALCNRPPLDRHLGKEALARKVTARLTMDYGL